jgi:serine protease Do
MTGWLVGTAILGLAALGPIAYGQTKWADEVAAVKWLATEQAVRVLGGSGGRIGVTIRDLGDEDLKSGKTGVIIDRVDADSPAEKGGMKAGDTVVEFDGERVRSSRQFARLVQETPPGRQIQAAVLRGGQRVTVTVQPRDTASYKSSDHMDDLFAMRPTPKIPPTPPPAPADAFPKFEFFMGTGRLGIAVEDLSPQLAEYFGAKDGVLVKSVDDNSVAGKAGVKAGDVITSLDGGSINTAADLRRRTQRLESGDEFTLGVVRDKKTLTLKGKLESQTRRSTVVLL